MPTLAGFQARVKRLLKSFQVESNPDLEDFVSGLHTGDPSGTIFDGEYGDLTAPKKPDFVERDNQGWEEIR